MTSQEKIAEILRSLKETPDEELRRQFEAAGGWPDQQSDLDREFAKAVSLRASIERLEEESRRLYTSYFKTFRSLESSQQLLDEYLPESAEEGCAVTNQPGYRTAA